MSDNPEEKNLFDENENPADDQWENEIIDDEEEEESYGLMSRIIGVFIEPGKAFMHIGQRPEILGALFFALVVLIGVTIITMNDMIPLTQAAAVVQMENSPQNIDEATIDKMVTVVVPWQVRFQWLGGLIFILIGWLLMGALAYVTGLFLGQESNFKSSMAVIAYASLPGILFKSGILQVVTFLSKSWDNMMDYQAALAKSTFSLYTFFGNSDMNVNIQALLISLDPFVIWALFLMAIGFKFANNIKSKQGWTVSIIITVLGIALGIPLIAMGLGQMQNAG